MGEAIIARGQTSAKNVLDDIPVSGDYCSILIQLKDSSGGPCENTKINCKDGSRWYNYTTNETGYALFKCNSGAANITANNWINGILTFDQNSFGQVDIDAPVGTKILKEIKFKKSNKYYQSNPGWTNGWFRGINRINNIIVVGGGGSGGFAGTTFSYSGYWYGYLGCGGGGGAKNFTSHIDISRNQLYNLYIGKGGDETLSSNNNGNTGSTTIAFGLSANGGSGGGFNGNHGGRGGIGLYNGGNGAGLGIGQWDNTNALPTNSNINGENGINGAGGGGAQYDFSSGNLSYNSYGGFNGGSNTGYYDNNGNIMHPKPGNKGSGGGGSGGAILGDGGGVPRVFSPSAGGSGRVEFDM